MIPTALYITHIPTHIYILGLIMAAPDGAEDVHDFLQRIRELGDRRDREDEERTRKLEDDIVQGRKERQARRAGEWTL